MGLRMGELLVRQGILTDHQVDEILRAQKQGGRPFGYLAEQMFGVSATQIEAVWAQQFASMTGRVDPLHESIDFEVLEIVSKRQAWQFGVMPLRRAGGELMLATTIDLLPRAIRFVTWQLSEPAFFVLCERRQLESALRQHYDLGGMRLPEMSSNGAGGLRRAS